MVLVDRPRSLRRSDFHSPRPPLHETPRWCSCLYDSCNAGPRVVSLMLTVSSRRGRGNPSVHFGGWASSGIYLATGGLWLRWELPGLSYIPECPPLRGKANGSVA